MISKPSQQFVEWLETRLKEMRPGEKFPIDKELAKAFDLSVLTVKKIWKKF